MRVRTLVNPFSCFQRFEKKNWAEIFPDFKGIIDVEVGCGNGLFLIHYALKNPNRIIVGFEIKERLVHFVREKIAEHKLINAYVFLGNAQVGLEDLFDDQTIDRIFVFHPDPWPKKVHHKRRVINHAVLKLMHQKIKPDGLLYLSTDVQELWEAMLAAINQSKLFEIKNDDEFWLQQYKTRWQEISQQKQKTFIYGSFCSAR